MNKITIAWHGEVVGDLIDARSDMWYLDGRWEPITSAHSICFVERSILLNQLEVMKGNQRGIVVEIRYENATKDIAILCGPVKQTACVRMVTNEKAIALVKTWEIEEKELLKL
jgi:hypothetical protein